MTRPELVALMDAAHWLREMARDALTHLREDHAQNVVSRNTADLLDEAIQKYDAAEDAAGEAGGGVGHCAGCVGECGRAGDMDECPGIEATPAPTQAGACPPGVCESCPSCYAEPYQAHVAGCRWAGSGRSGGGSV
jgi:hypothetical protein